MKDKVVLITGASSGIGRALAHTFASKGSRIVLMARREDQLKALEAELAKANSSVAYFVGDVSKETDCRAFIDLAMQRFGRIDVLINNAGLSMRALFNEVNLNVLRQLMDVNFWGTVYCTKYALPELLKSKGSLVGISSIAGKKGLPARTGYSASKFAMEGFMETLRTENLKKGLHVLVACPGFTASNIRNVALAKDGTSQGESPRDEQKMMSAEEVAERIYRGIVDRKRDLVMTGEGKLAVWLNRLFPSWSDKLIFNHMAKEADSPLK
jgi:dehydrogenase/reductase SDR family protein 7B